MARRTALRRTVSQVIDMATLFAPDHMIGIHVLSTGGMLPGPCCSASAGASAALRLADLPPPHSDRARLRGRLAGPKTAHPAGGVSPHTGPAEPVGPPIGRGGGFWRAVQGARGAAR